MQKNAHQRYETFDQQRRCEEALAEDQQDRQDLEALENLEALEQSLKDKQP